MTSYPFVATGQRATQQEHFCSCIFKVTGKNYRTGYVGNPYAMCTASVYGSKGLQGPGPVRCFYTRDYLASLRYHELYDYAQAKQLIPPGSRPRFDQLVELIYDWLHAEQEKVIPGLPPPELLSPRTRALQLRAPRISARAANHLY